MPLPVAHGLLGATIVAALYPKLTRIESPMYLVAGALLANAADLDFFLVAGLGSKAWHRGFTHSIVFSLLVWLLFIVILGNRKFRNAMAYGLAFTSHCLLDYLTSKDGGGVELLWPLSTARFTLGWWGLSEMPSRLTRMEIVEAVAVETALFSLLLLAIVLLRRSLAKSMSSTTDAI